MRDYTVGDTFDIKFTSRRFTTGAPFTLAGTPAVSAYPDNSVTQLTAGITLTADFDGVTGLNNVRVVATVGNGYAAGSTYVLVITTGTVDSVSVVGEVIGEFTLGRAAAFARLGAPGGASVSADILVLDNLVDDLESRLGTPSNLGTGATIAANLVDIEGQTDDIGAAGAGLTALASQASVTTIDDFLDTEVAATLAAVDTEVGAIKTKTDFLPSATAGAAGGVFIAGANAATSVTTALTANITGNLSGSVGSVTGAVGSVTAGVTLAASAVQAIWDALTTALTTVGSIGKRLADFITGDAFVRLGAPAGASTAADIAAVKSDSAAILVDTGTTLDGRIPSALTGAGNMKSDMLAINGNATSAAVLAILNGATVVYQGTVTGAATVTTLIDTGLTQADTDWWKGRIIIFTSVITLQATDITAFDPATDKLTFTAVTSAPTGATYIII